jgi:hypothetical protein
MRMLLTKIPQPSRDGVLAGEAVIAAGAD